MICFDKNKYKHKIRNEKNIPIPPDVEIGNSWKAWGFSNSSSINNFKLYLFKINKKYL